MGMGEVEGIGFYLFIAGIDQRLAWYLLEPLAVTGNTPICCCAVVDSIRNPKEVEALRMLPRFVLVGIQAPLDLRYARSKQRAREGDPTTVEEFELRERQENTANPTAQQLAATFALADRVLDNDGSLERLEAALDRLLQEWGLDSNR